MLISIYWFQESDISCLHPYEDFNNYLVLNSLEATKIMLLKVSMAYCLQYEVSQNSE